MRSSTTLPLRSKIQGRTPGRLPRRVFSHLPAVFVWLMAFSFLDQQFRYPPTRPDLAPTVLFPLIPFGAYWLLRHDRAEPVRVRNRLLPLLAACMAPVAVVLVIRGAVGTAAITEDQFFRVQEPIRLLFFPLMAIHCQLTRSGADVVKFFGVGLVYGTILENGGILAGFFAEPGYTLYVPGLPAPVVNVVGWSIALYLAISLWEGIAGAFPVAGRRPAFWAGGVTAVALLLDLQIDPHAAHRAWWIWHPTLEPVFFGVPLINFLAWAAAVFPFAWCYRSLEMRRDLGERERILRLTAAVPPALAVALGLVLALTGVFCGLASPTMALFARTGSALLSLL